MAPEELDPTAHVMIEAHAIVTKTIEENGKKLARGYYLRNLLDYHTDDVEKYQVTTKRFKTELDVNQIQSQLNAI